ncbi:MAG TPA: hypothetical protein VGN12_19480 [Pirellulales bacterium]|jgi:hypothetical protein
MAKKSQWESRRQDERVAKDADQAELVAVKYSSCNLEAGTFDDRIADAMEDYEVADPKGPLPRWASEDIQFESATSEIALEVRRRADLLAEHYPFSLDGNRLLYQRSDTLVYEFCLAVSLSDSLSVGEFARLPIAFERLVRDALICYLGNGAKGYRTGWPADELEERPVKFKGVISKLQELTGEWHWSPDPDLDDDPTHLIAKDQGLDIVVWKPLDRRGGQLFLLGQCACGNAYATKYHDLDHQLTSLTQWVKPVSWAAPVRVFSTPRHIPNDLEFQQVNKVAGLTVDRARLTLLAEFADHRAFIKQNAKDSYASLIKLIITDFQVDPQVI